MKLFIYIMTISFLGILAGRGNARRNINSVLQTVIGFNDTQLTIHQMWLGHFF